MNTILTEYIKMNLFFPIFLYFQIYNFKTLIISEYFNTHLNLDMKKHVIIVYISHKNSFFNEVLKSCSKKSTHAKLLMSSLIVTFF